MDDFPDLDTLAGDVFTPKLNLELGIGDRTVRRDGQYLRFRLDPGNVFELHGLIQAYSDGACGVAINQRYRPHEPMIWVAGATVDTADVPGVLRAAVRYARDRDRELPHWFLTRQEETPRWAEEFLDTDLAAARGAIEASAARARHAGAVMYLSTQPGSITSANNPPEGGPFFSVTPAGDWAVHWQRCTRPLPEPPRDTGLTDADIWQSVQVARQDQLRAGAMVPLPTTDVARVRRAPAATSTETSRAGRGR